MSLLSVPSRTYLRGALIGGGIAAALLAGVTVVVGSVSGLDGRILLSASQPTIRFLASSVATASATTLALLLTMVGLSAKTDIPLTPDYYRRLRRIARLDVATFIVAVVLLVALVIPLDEQVSLSGRFYSVAYYAISSVAALAAGLLIAVVLALYGAAHDLIETCFLEGDPLQAEQEDDPDSAD